MRGIGIGTHAHTHIPRIPNIRDPSSQKMRTKEQHRGTHILALSRATASPFSSFSTKKRKKKRETLRRLHSAEKPFRSLPFFTSPHPMTAARKHRDKNKDELCPVRFKTCGGGRKRVALPIRYIKHIRMLTLFGRGFCLMGTLPDLLPTAVTLSYMRTCFFVSPSRKQSEQK